MNTYVLKQMGSLMAGWNSPVPDPRTVKIQRNKSLTKEGIEAYWRSRKKAEEEHLSAVSDTLMKSSQETIIEESEGKIQRSSSLPLVTTKTKEGLLEMETDQTNLEKFKMKKNGWWTRSNSAFLNEPLL